MADPFETALAALHRAPGSSAAVYREPNGVAVPLRVIRDTGTTGTPVGSTVVEMDTDSVQIRVADVMSPREGASLTLGDIVGGSFVARESFVIQGGAVRTDRMTWTCGIVPA